MDRLLCGDVGYGKTEVAIRAAFKAIADGKQVAIISANNDSWRSSIMKLCWKAFKTIRLKLGLLSRFRTRKQQTETIKGLKMVRSILLLVRIGSYQKILSIMISGY